MGDGADELDTVRAEVDLLRRRVLNVVGHELRTPITTLRGLAELLGTTPDDPLKTAAVRVMRGTWRAAIPPAFATASLCAWNPDTRHV